MLIALLLGACAPATPDAPSSTLKLPSPAATSRPTEQALVSPPATATLVPTLTPLPTATPRPTPSPGQLVVVHTNDNWGETEPCGWGKYATGGFRRRATFIAAQARQATHLLVLDAGDALAGDGGLGDQTEGKVIVDGMNLMGYDAMALGPLDLALGADALAQRMAEAEFPMLSANVVDAATGQSVAPAFVVVAVGDHRVALVGLTRPPRQAPPATAALPNQPGLASEPVGEFRVLDPAQAAAEAVAQAAPQADTVILLTNLEYRAALALVEGLPEVDLVVAALPTQLPQMAVRSATGALVVVADQSMPRHSGRRVGRLMVTMESDGRLTGEQWESIPMDGTVADDLAMQILLATYAQP